MIQGQILLELERYQDGKSVFVDPAHVVAVEPGDAENTAYIRLYSLGGSVWVLGSALEVSAMICKSRELINQLSLGAAVSLIREEIEKKEVIN